MTVIEFKNVSKSFHRQHGAKLLRTYVRQWLGREEVDAFFALKNLSFSLSEGECVGVIGSNGAGKSTLLSLITRLLPPTSGTVTVKGRVAALLELGAGFHPDLTGRENVILNASLLGLSQAKTAELFDGIVDFAEMNDFIDEPMRTYSSGMTMRLAFSVAVNLDPDILIIDEVLAVGDQSFQAKCMDRIGSIKAQGKTILFVSHSGATVQQLCDRALWLDHGELVMQGLSGEVIQAYEGRAASHAS